MSGGAGRTGLWRWLLAAYVVLIGVIALRLGADEARRTREGRALVAGEVQLQARWRAITGQQVSDDAELNRLQLAIEGLGFAALFESDRDDFRRPLWQLLRVPPPDRLSSELAVRAAAANSDAALALERALEDAPLSPLLWRGQGGPSAAPVAFDAQGAPMEVAVAGGSPFSQAGPPWGEAVLSGALLQDLASRPGQPRATLASLGALGVPVAEALRPWCFAELERLELSACRPLDEASLPSGRQALEDPDVPLQVAVLWASMQTPAELLLGMVDDTTLSDGARLRATMAFARAAPRWSAEGALVGWLRADSPPFLPVIAALELLRLRSAPQAPDIRAAAQRLSPAEALTLRWIADVLEDPGSYDSAPRRPSP